MRRFSLNIEEKSTIVMQIGICVFGITIEKIGDWLADFRRLRIPDERMIHGNQRKSAYYS